MHTRTAQEAIHIQWVTDTFISFPVMRWYLWLCWWLVCVLTGCIRRKKSWNWRLVWINLYSLIRLRASQFPFMGTRTASPRGRYGERLSVTRVWRYIFKNTTCWPATAHDVTTGVPQYKCRREITSSAFSSSLTGLFEETCILVGIQFSFIYHGEH